MYNGEVPDRENSTESVVRDLQLGKNVEANFHVLFDRYYGQVRTFMRRKYLSLEDAEELTQDVFISVYKGLGGLNDPAQFEGWLFRIALNAFRNHFERSRAKKRDGILVELSDDDFEAKADPAPALATGIQVDPVANLIAAERREAIRATIETLPDQMRRCLTLRVAHDLSNPEIAHIMGISVNTVKAHLHQARKLLAEKLGASMGEF